MKIKHSYSVGIGDVSNIQVTLAEDLIMTQNMIYDTPVKMFQIYVGLSETNAFYLFP